MSTTPYLKTVYQDKIVPELKEKLGLSNIHEIPALSKIVLNTGYNSATDKATVEAIARDMGLIAGQKPIITRAKQAISNFKLREDMPVGAKVTLRGARMYDFFYRFIAVALPAIRDFRGVSPKMDGQGNYNIGITDHTIFPEINVDGRNISMGMDIAICTTATNDAHALELLTQFGVPFRKRETATTEA